MENYKNIIQFISHFKDILLRLKDCGATIEDIDQKTVFISALSKKYPIWAERSRARLRTPNPPSLADLTTDILDERHGTVFNAKSTIRDHDGDVIMKDAYYTAKKKPFY